MFQKWDNGQEINDNDNIDFSDSKDHTLVVSNKRL
jgi:hypothetical protein